MYNRVSIIAAFVIATVALAIGAPSARATTTASFNGCVYHTDTYLQAVEAWLADGAPYCGVTLSVNVDSTVSGTVTPSH